MKLRSRVSFLVAVTFVIAGANARADDPTEEAKRLAEQALQVARLDEALHPQALKYRVRDTMTRLDPQTHESDPIVVYIDAPQTYDSLKIDAIRDVKKFPGRPKIHPVETELPNGKIRRVVLITRAQLLPEKDLRALADSLALPPMAPTYSSGAVTLIPQGTFTGRATDDSKVDAAKMLLKEKGYSIKAQTFLSRSFLAEKPEPLAAQFDAIKELERSGKFIWCEPGFISTGRFLLR